MQKVPTESYAHVLPRKLCKRFLQNHMHMYYQDNCAKGSYRIICTCITKTIVQKPKVPTEPYANFMKQLQCTCICKLTIFTWQPEDLPDWHWMPLVIRKTIHMVLLKGDSNSNDKCVLSERALWTMNFDTSIINHQNRLKNVQVMGI